MKPFLIYTPYSPLYAAEKLQFNDYSALLFQFIGSWSPEMQFCEIYLCTGRLCPWQYNRTVTSWLGRVTCTKPRRSLVAVTVLGCVVVGV